MKKFSSINMQKIDIVIGNAHIQIIYTFQETVK